MAATTTNEEIARRYVVAASANDLDSLAALRDPDWQVSWPQSGERVIGTDDFRAIVSRYPGGTPRTEIRRVVGDKDRWVVTPSNTALRVAGEGDLWWGEWSVTYPDGQTYFCIDLIELRGGRVWRETVYWATPFEAPEWRAPWVRRDSKGEDASAS
ncbi:MAG TPA: nuclear transport factor 2 family protein [Candidatus Limnocylindrales bacterium]|jgi:SnoaL-like domain